MANRAREVEVDGLARRRFLTGAAAVAGAAALSACARGSAPDDAAASPLPRPKTADEALERLLASNRRFAEGGATRSDRSPARRRAVAEGQEPWAVVLGCIDSRVPPEIVFDQGLGDLFVVRSAGQVIDDAVLGSIEFGVAEFRVPLVVVLGHQRCGAVVAAAELAEQAGDAHGAVQTIVDAIEPALEEAEATEGGDLIDEAVRANVASQVERLEGSSVVGPLASKGDTRIVGAYYSLDTGRVIMLERGERV